jgi:hypothetical protein
MKATTKGTDESNKREKSFTGKNRRNVFKQRNTERRRKVSPLRPFFSLSFSLSEPV